MNPGVEIELNPKRNNNWKKHHSITTTTTRSSILYIGSRTVLILIVLLDEDDEVEGSTPGSGDKGNQEYPIPPSRVDPIDGINPAIQISLTGR